MPIAANGLSATLRARALRTLLLLALIVATTVPAEARRLRLSGGSLGGGATVEKVYDLPRTPELQLVDGRPIDIGRIRGGTKAGTFVGYVGSSREYLNLPANIMDELVGHAGFTDMSAFEKHLADKTRAVDEKRKADAATAAERKQLALTAARERAALRAHGIGDGAALADDGTAGSGSGSFWTILLAIGLQVLILFVAIRRVYRWLCPPRQTARADIEAPAVAAVLNNAKRGSRTAQSDEAAPAPRATRNLSGTPAFGRR